MRVPRDNEARIPIPRDDPVGPPFIEETAFVAVLNKIRQQALILYCHQRLFLIVHFNACLRIASPPSRPLSKPLLPLIVCTSDN